MKVTTKKLLPREAERAIYIDFEGNKDMDPTLLGVLVEGCTDRWIVEPRFVDCADRQGARAGRADLRDLTLSLLALAEAEDRFIVSWSRHDYRKMVAVLDHARDRRRLDVVYRNAIRTARRWRKECQPDMDLSCNNLQGYAKILAWPTPEKIGRGTVGPWLRRLRDRLNIRDGRWSELTPRQRRAWKDILRHNWHDLGQTRVVSCYCARQLEARSRRRGRRSKAVRQASPALSTC